MSTDKADSRKSVCLLTNPHLRVGKDDVLHHFGLDTETMDFKAVFGDTQFVCCGGSANRMSSFAIFMAQELGHVIPREGPINMSNTDRFVLFKVGPVVCVNHGMGVPSLSIMLNEIIKMVYYAGCTGVKFIRIGTSGGIGIEGGTVVIANEAVNDMLKPEFEYTVLGKRVSYSAVLDNELMNILMECATPDDKFQTVLGKTMCTDDFYEGQGRLDGTFCDYTEEDKMDFLTELHRKGVMNIEMEATCFSALCHRAGIKCAIVCVALLDRLHGDQTSMTKEVLAEWQQRPQKLVARYIKRQLTKA